MFIVFNVTTVSNIYIIGSNVSNVRTTGLADAVSPNANYVILKSGVVLGAIQSGVTNATTILATTTVNTSSSQTTASLNGKPPSTATNISSFNAGTTYIGKDTNIQNGFTGNFMEIMIYNRVLTNDEKQKVEGYLGWKWSLQSTFPANHPYRTYNPFTTTGVTVDSIRQNQIIQITGGTGTITFNGISKISILVVGGGGAGGKDTGGGGGGGGVIALSNISVTSGTAYTITVGAGGTVTENKGNNGGNSVFGVYTAIGGGGGADAVLNTSTPSGGCGGGGSSLSNNLTGGIATQGTTNGNNGYNGGNGANNGTSISGGGGGGGAGGIGSNAKTTSTPYGGNGGIGYSSNITGTATFYAGGGGGGTWIPNGGNGSPSTGGTGGGGAGGAGSLSAVAGTPNTGGGGGGGGFNDRGLPGAGGSGIVIIRYFF